MNEPGASIAGLKLALTFIMTTRGVPMLYSGDEIAMPGAGDPDNRRDFPGGWPGDPHNAFESSGRTPDQESAFEHLRQLAHLRGELEPLRRGKLVDLAVGDQTYAYARITAGASVIVIINNATTDATLEFDAGPAHFAEGVTLTDRLGSAPPLEVRGGKIRTTLPGRSAGIYAESPRNSTVGPPKM
jgi:glycosidase